MAKNLAPSSTGASSGTWLNEAASAVNLHQSIDEQNSPNDSDFVIRDTAAVDEYIEFPLEDPIGEQTGESCTLEWRAGDADTSTVLSAQLRQGATVIATDSRELGTSPATYQYTLTADEKNAINDWTDLRVRFVVDDPRTLSSGSVRTLSDGRARTIS